LTDDIYEKLANALNKIPNGFPRSPSRVELRILKKIFSPEEASLAACLTGSMESVSKIASRTGIPLEQLEKRLLEMADRGLLWRGRRGCEPSFRLAPFIVGIYESQLEDLDHELAHLVEEYLTNGGAVGIMKPEPALHRVVPSQRAIKSEWILPYDDVKQILLNMKTFRLRDCICRKEQELVGRNCSFPMRTCLGFSSFEAPHPGPLDISREEALAFLDKAEEIGLVHTVSNVIKGVGYVCNCCGCCCGILRGINEWGIEKSVARANYYATIDSEQCVGCGTCRSRCQVHAISEEDNVSIVDVKKCIGCGLCATGCPNGAAKLVRKTGVDVHDPPLNFSEWEHERLHNRGLT
jgi:ferredoxin